MLSALVFGVKFPKAFEIRSSRRCWLGAFTRRCAKFKAVEPLGDIAIPGAFWILAVIDDRKAGICLTSDHFGYRTRQVPLVGGIVDGLMLEALPHILDQFWRPHQAAYMCRLNAVGVGLHS